MKVLKVINNNVISSNDENGKEVIAMGKGIGFQKKPGDVIEYNRIEKVFRLPQEHTSQFEELVADMPYEHMQIAEEIIHYARQTLDRHLNKNIYITLTDHLNFALERQKKGIAFQNALLWEIRKFYHEEYRIGLKAVEMVKRELGVELPEDEAGFIALHLVNAEMDGDIRRAINIPGIIKDLLNIVQYTFGLKLDESTLYYERFVTHLKFLVQRAVKHEYYETDDPEFNLSFQVKYRKEYECALKMKDYMNKKMDYRVTDEELTYLTIHIHRVIRTSKGIKEIK